MSKNSTYNSTKKKDFYLLILRRLKTTTNLTKIRDDLGISKQNLNYYLRRLKKEGLIINDSYGSWRLTKESKNPSKYGRHLSKDTTRGHAYIINIKLSKIPENWNNRISILSERGINFKLVGAMNTTPSIKCLGRRVWLCNKHLRIYDRPNESYYGDSAIECRKLALFEFLKIINALEGKLGIKLNHLDIDWRKEHYALIKNDLAIHHNLKGEIVRIDDIEGEWLLVDDSFGEGGELEVIGKKAFQTHPKLKRWWNDNKKHNFDVTPTYVLETMNGIQQNQLIFAENMNSHIEAIQTLSSSVKELKEEIKKIINTREIK